MPKPLGHRHALRLSGGYFQGDGPGPLGFSCIRRGALDEALVDGDHPDVGQHRFGNQPASRRHGRRVHRLRQDQVDAVTRPDQAGTAADDVDADGDRPHVRAENGRKEAVIAGPQDVRRQHRFPGAQTAAHHGTPQLRPLLRRIQAGAGGNLGGRHFRRDHIVRLEEAARTKCMRRDEYFGEDGCRQLCCGGFRRNWRARADPGDDTETPEPERQQDEQGHTQDHCALNGSAA